MAKVPDIINQQLGEINAAVVKSRDYIYSYIQGLNGFSHNAMTWAKWSLDNYGAEGISLAKQLLASGITAEVSYFGQAITYIGYGLSYTYNAIAQASTNLISIIEGLIASAGAAAYDYFYEQISNLSNFIAQGFDVVISAVESKFNTTVQEIGMSISNIFTFINGKLNDLGALLIPAINSVKDVIKEVVSVIPETLIKLLYDTFIEEEKITT
jgi:phage-related protein